MTSKAPRRFKPEPFEVSSSKGGPQEASEPEEIVPKKKIRKFAVEPVETSSRHGGGAKDTEDAKEEGDETGATEQTAKAGRRRFAPEPVETSSRTNRKGVDALKEEEVPSLPHERAVEAQDFAKKPAPRKFKPELIGTAKRSRRAGDAGTALHPEDKTNASPTDTESKWKRSQTAPHNTDGSASIRVPEFPPYRQSTLNPHNNTRVNSRHSYMVPSLETVESSESEESGKLSPSESKSVGSDTTNEYQKDETRRRESDDDRFSGYLLALAARAANKQLREQAAAAFPNSDQHEPISHFMNQSSSDDESLEQVSTNEQSDRTRRDSEDEQHALEELQRHGREILKKKQKQDREFGTYQYGPDPRDRQDWEMSGSNNNLHVAGYQTMPKRVIGGHQRDKDLKQMRKAASPPMLGGDIGFPRCPSPEYARFDITQGSDYLKMNMDNLGAGNDGRGLWGVQKTNQQPPEQPSIQKADDNQAGGLWGGMCTEQNARISKQPSGIVTPRHSPTIEKDDPFSVLHTSPGTNAPASVGRRGPMSPPSSSTNLAALASSPGRGDSHSSARNLLKMDIEEQVKAEFTDAFITQVYNYLSLGYSAIARNYDEEICRISGVAVEELRLDDELAFAAPKGYIRLGSDEDVVVDVDSARQIGRDVDSAHMKEDSIQITESMCTRWRALKLYVHEWGRQMVQKERGRGNAPPSQDPSRAWGLPQRRGSWGL